MFQKHNNTNFTTAMRPILKSLFYMKYEGKDGAQNLQRDLRYIKIATNSQIPEDQSLDHISNLISKGNPGYPAQLTHLLHQKMCRNKTLISNQIPQVIVAHQRQHQHNNHYYRILHFKWHSTTHISP